MLRNLAKRINHGLYQRAIRVQSSMPQKDMIPGEYNGISCKEAYEGRKKNFSKGLAISYKEPILITQGHKQWLWDSTGKRYLDLFAGIVTVSVGHCHPKVNDALHKQIERLWHTTSIYMYPGHSEYAEKLTKKLPGDLKVCLFTNSGSEANDLAMHLTRLYTGRYDLVTLRNGYHGMSSNTMGLTSMGSWKYSVPTGLGIHHAMVPDVYNGIWGGKYCRDSPIQTNRDCNCDPNDCQACGKYVDQFKEILNFSAPKGGKIAGVFMESIQGVGGTHQFPKNYVKEIANIVQSNGGLYIADEVQTGFGRTGSKYWGFENHDAHPDIVVMAKGIGNGFPMACVVTRPEIADVLSQALHFNTYGGNPMACAVGSAVLDVIDEENLQENCENVGTYFMKELAKLRDEFEIVGDVRGKGLMIGLEFVENKETRKALNADKVNAIFEATKNKGVLFGKGGLNGNILRIKPPMCVTKSDTDFAVQILRESILDNL